MVWHHSVMKHTDIVIECRLAEPLILVITKLANFDLIISLHIKYNAQTKFPFDIHQSTYYISNLDSSITSPFTY